MSMVLRRGSFWIHKDRARLSGCGHSLHRHPGMVRRTRPGISGFRVRGFASPRNDDTIYPALEVTELTPGRSTGVVSLRSTVFNQRRELVLEGLQKFLIRRRPA